MILDIKKICILDGKKLEILRQTPNAKNIVIIQRI